MTLTLEQPGAAVGGDWPESDPGLSGDTTHYTPRHAMAETATATEPRRALPSPELDGRPDSAGAVQPAEPRRAQQGGLRALLARIQH